MLKKTSFFPYITSSAFNTRVVFIIRGASSASPLLCRPVRMHLHPHVPSCAVSMRNITSLILRSRYHCVPIFYQGGNLKAAFFVALVKTNSANGFQKESFFHSACNIGFRSSWTQFYPPKFHPGPDIGDIGPKFPGIGHLSPTRPEGTGCCSQGRVVCAAQHIH
jgi:hypothetical protein